ncbi:MAG: AAA family ATPase [Acidimicrobiales bacterium]
MASGRDPERERVLRARNHRPTTEWFAEQEYAPDQCGLDPVAPSLESFHLVDWSSFWAVDDAVEQWIVDPVLPKGRSTAIYAPAKTGKSLLALEIAAAVATGRRIMHQQDGQARSTLYLDYEMTEDDLRDRLISLGYGPEDDLSLLHYALLPSLPPLNTAAGGDELGRLVEALAVEVVIIDTFGRAAEGEENSNDTTRSFYAHSGVMLKRLGVTSLRLDHAGKDLAKGQRGASAKNDDVDVVWQLTVAEGDAVKLKRTHSRMSWIEAEVNLRRYENPLSHRIIAESWPAGTKETADDLDALRVPIDASRRAAERALSEAGKGKRHEVVAAALRYRLVGPQIPGTTPWTDSGATEGDH